MKYINIKGYSFLNDIKNYFQSEIILLILVFYFMNSFILKFNQN